MAVALGVVAVALLGILALLPMGIQTNNISADESTAANIITELEADLRNTYPTASFNNPPNPSGQSQLFGLALPYKVSSNFVVLNNILTTVTTSSAVVPAGYTTGLDATLSPKAITASTHFQASVIYTNIPAAGSLAPIQARLIVNWPAINNATVSELTDVSKVKGYVQAYVTFSAP
jgi:hypothetical protein